MILLLVAIYNAFSRSKVYEAKDKKLYKITMIFAHIQFTLGLIMYFMSPKVKFVEGFMKSEQLRFYGMEHLVGMLLAVVFITLAKSKSEKLEGAENKQKKAKLFFVLALVTILAFIPWPFREALGGAWF